MLFKSFLATGVLAWQTSAFLVPLEVSQAAKDPALKHQVVELDCPGCPFAGANGDGSVWTQNDTPISIVCPLDPLIFHETDTIKHLEFDITDDDQFLQINGQPVFPPPKTLIPTALKASQVSALDQSQTEPLRLGYALEVLPSMSEVTDIALTPVQLTILDLHGVAVKVDTVRIDLIHSWGHLHIARVTTMPYSQSPGANKCITSICRLRAIIANRLRKMIESAKAHAGKAKTWIKNACPGRKQAQAGAEQDHKKSHHHAHHRHGHFHRFIKTASIIFGSVLAITLMLVVRQAWAYLSNRRSRRDGAGSPRNIEAAVEEDEKDALMENGEMPPQYEDVDVIVVEKN